MKRHTEKYTVVLTTVPTKAEARRIANTVLKQRLVACVNILDGTESRFWWRGKIDRAQECLLVMKTARRAVPRLAEAIVKLHSYEVPEVVVLPIEAGSERYLNWISANVK